MIQAGANLVIHHHPHTLQGIEIFEGGLIAYSLGNLIFPLENSEYMSDRPGRVDLGAYLKVHVQKLDGKYLFTPELVPIELISGDLSRIADRKTQQEVMGAMARFSEILEAPYALRLKYIARCRTEVVSYIRGLYYAGRKSGVRGAWRHAVHPFRTLMARHGLIGYFSRGWF